MFNARRVKEDIVRWIRDWFEKNGPGCNAIIGISGGKDSSVVAALCVEALGRDRVIGVLMPDGEQADIDKSYKICDLLGIKHYVCDIHDAVEGVYKSMSPFDFDISDQTRTNLPARIRMSTLYAVSQSNNGRVSNNCNLSEEYVGYSTRYGDAAGDFAPLLYLTVSEVKAVGYALGLPEDLIEKTPSDGLCGKTDEDNLGFSYATLDTYIRKGICENPYIKARIDWLHEKNKFKASNIPSFLPWPEDLV